MSDDLVKRLRKRQEFEFIDGYKRIEWFDADALEAADLIEELSNCVAVLEAKLAKAVEIALEECPFGAGTGHSENWWYDRHRLLAELKGEDRG